MFEKSIPFGADDRADLWLLHRCLGQRIQAHAFGTYWPLISPLVFSLSPYFQAESGRVKYNDISNNGT